jgi:hypothetical protein
MSMKYYHVICMCMPKGICVFTTGGGTYGCDNVRRGEMGWQKMSSYMHKHTLTRVHSCSLLG